MASPKTNIDKARRAACRAADLLHSVVVEYEYVKNNVPAHSARGIGLKALRDASVQARTKLDEAIGIIVAAQDEGATAESVRGIDNV